MVAAALRVGGPEQERADDLLALVVTETADDAVGAAKSLIFTIAM
jgi:hypothetical protein